MSHYNYEEIATGIRVYPGEEDVSASNIETPANNRSEVRINIDDDEAYYEAHKPATGLPTMGFFGSAESSLHPQNWQLTVVNTEENKQEQKSKCVIS